MHGPMKVKFYKTVNSNSRVIKGKCDSCNEINKFKIPIIIERISKTNSTTQVNGSTGGGHIPVYQSAASVSIFQKQGIVMLLIYNVYVCLSEGL